MSELQKKEKTNWKVTLASLLLGAALVLTGWATGLLKNEPPLKGAVGVDAIFATSTAYTVLADGTVTTLTASSSCAMRVITTKVSPILLTFNGQSPTPTQGILQAASTTVNYASEQYGCGAVKASTANSGASLVTFTEFR